MKILYFASLREAIGVATEEIQLAEGMQLSDLRQLLIKKYGADSFPENIICAVNHRTVTKDASLCADDEVAFYPPVTGG